MKRETSVDGSIWLRIVLVTALTLALGGCVAVPVSGGYGYYEEPVPYGGPVYGYEYLNPDGVTVFYDSGPGYYGVRGYPGVYWWNDHYYRYHGGRWEWSKGHLGPWERPHADTHPYRHQPVYPLAHEPANQIRADEGGIYFGRPETRHWRQPSQWESWGDRHNWTGTRERYPDSRPQPYWTHQPGSFNGRRPVSDSNGVGVRSPRSNDQGTGNWRREGPQRPHESRTPHGNPNSEPRSGATDLRGVPF